ncbi:DrmB family protein [Amycolatopsis thailandensis]|uniref:DrmB family protein n=1 Tax=Amycolatopsis thailandensis TaxID=589330 RepID=UPI00366A0DBB
MALRNPESKSAAQKKTSGPRLGSIRRGQAVNTYGVGAMVAIEDQSFVVGGLDEWRFGDTQPIHEPRLQNRLGVKEFRPPPAEERKQEKRIGVRRFPLMHSCPDCKDLKTYKEFGATPSKNECGCGSPLIPSRFVVACPNGHLDDFPYWDWLHKRNDAREGPHNLKMHNDGSSASLRSVVVSCSCGHTRSLEGAFAKTALQSLGIICQGRRPWLGRHAAEPGCEQVVRTLQRGSSAAWFAVTRSSLSIPPWSNTLNKFVERHISWLEGLASLSNAEEAIGTLPAVKESPFTTKDIVAAVLQRKVLTNDESGNSDDVTPVEAFDAFRMAEYDPLYFGTTKSDGGDDFESTSAPDAQSVLLPRGLARSMQVKRLREVRALQAFTRIEPPDAIADKKRLASLARVEKDWLPAIEVLGEGVFLSLDTALVADWEKRDRVRFRAERIRERHENALRNSAVRRGDADTTDVRSPIDARFVLAHTLAHTLINEWSLEAGYPAASLRERLYVSDSRVGLLVYTATSDSAGSLGGLVAQGTHTGLVESMGTALERISWCSQDPPCMEAEAAGTDSLNLAACYACVMLPESSCETNNTFLDRALLIGEPEHVGTGFFEGP